MRLAKQIRVNIILFILLLSLHTVTLAQTNRSLLTKQQLKVLDIGNSYTKDAVSMLQQFIDANNADISDMCLYMAYRGGGSFKNWYDIYGDNDNNSYYISKIIGGIDANVPTGFGKANDGSLFREVLTSEKWDLIIIHQTSTYAPYYNLWKGTSDEGYLNELLGIIKENQPQAKIGFLLIHSYWDNYAINKEKSSFLRWELIANSVKNLCEEYTIDLVIPYGTAIENLRSSLLNNEYDLTSDGSHCGIGLACYTAACCYYESLIAPRVGISIMGNPTRYDASHATSTYPAISVTDDNALLAQTAAVLAVRHPYQCINPEDSIVTMSIVDRECLHNTMVKAYTLDGHQVKAPRLGRKNVKYRNGKIIIIMK